MSHDRPVRLYLCQTNKWPWRWARGEQDRSGIELVDRRDAHRADMVIYHVPATGEPPSPERLRRLGPSTWRKLFVYSTLDRPVRFAPGVYASAPADAEPAASFRGGPYPVDYHRPTGLVLEPRPLDGADLLWSFVGAATNHPVRSAVLALDDPRSLRGDRPHDTNATSPDPRRAFDAYAELLRRSRFVVCPRGVGPSSVRLFEAMAAGRCPVIIGDDWLPPPFVDWDTCAVRVAERDVQHMPALLRELEPRAGELGAAARTAWEEHFAPERRLAFLVAACQDIVRSGGATPRARAVTLANCLRSRAFAHAVRHKSIGPEFARLRGTFGAGAR